MKNGVSYVDLELEEFENKINSITEQFMSLLNSDESIESSVTDKYTEAATILNNGTGSDSISYNSTIGKETISYNSIAGGNTVSYSNITGGDSISYSDITGNGSVTYKNITGPTIFNENSGGSTFKLRTEDINIGGIQYGKEEYSQGLPKHAVKFDSVEQMELNNKLESLYETKKSITTNIYEEKPTIAFSDSNIGKINSMGINSIYENYTNDKTNSTLNNKEVYEMSNYNGEGNIGEGNTTGNVFYSFATIPAERALVEKRSWKDTLFMDIPWDTKIDIWGGIKKFCTAQVKITF